MAEPSNIVFLDVFSVLLGRAIVYETIVCYECVLSQEYVLSESKN